jgi:hypothetical protein
MEETGEQSLGNFSLPIYQESNHSEQKDQQTHSNFFYQIWARFLLWLRRVFGGGQLLQTPLNIFIILFTLKFIFL